MGETRNILFISAYIPRKTRENPTQSQNLSALERLCHTLQAKYPYDQLLIGMDANAKMAKEPATICRKVHDALPEQQRGRQTDGA